MVIARGRAFCLFSKTQALNHSLVSFHILFLQVIEKFPPLSDEFQKSSTGMVILFVGLKMFC